MNQTFTSTQLGKNPRRTARLTAPNLMKTACTLLALTLAFVTITGCSSTEKPLKTQASVSQTVDPNLFAGEWFHIFRNVAIDGRPLPLQTNHLSLRLESGRFVGSLNRRAITNAVFAENKLGFQTPAKIENSTEILLVPCSVELVNSNELSVAEKDVEFYIGLTGPTNPHISNGFAVPRTFLRLGTFTLKEH